MRRYYRKEMRSIMIEEQCNIWDKYEQGEWICILTNCNTNSRGEAVMGRGIAKEAKDRFPDLPRIIGRYLRNGGFEVHIPMDRIIVFPTKIDWRQMSSIKLIITSCHQLMDIMDSLNIQRVYLPRPGCGNGGLLWQDVRTAIEPLLDDRVIVVWR